MRKVLLSAASLTVAGFMLHGAFACELNREASQPASTVVLPVGCSGSNCLISPRQDRVVALLRHQWMRTRSTANCAPEPIERTNL